jgi:hypothetical protein
MECPSENEGLHAIDMIDIEFATEPPPFINPFLYPIADLRRNRCC